VGGISQSGGCSSEKMKEKTSKDSRKFTDVGGEPECIQFLITLGEDPWSMFLSSYERWKLKERVDWTDPKSAAAHMGSLADEFLIRDKFINRYGFAILWSVAIEAMRPYAPLLEIGAGSGYWTYELKKHGIDCIATDTMDGQYGFFSRQTGEEDKLNRWQKQYIEIEKLNSVEAVRKYPKRNLLTVWPDYNSSWAADALDIFTGQVVIYMGEGPGNATADDRFHELLDQRFGNQEFIPMPHFEYSYDRLLLICKQPKQLTGRKT
jgi:hypothetical protein